MVYRFTTGFPEAINQSSLKNLLCSGYPVVTLMALDLVQLRTVQSMGDEDVYTGAHYDPTVYGLFQEYKEDTWSVDLYVVPCERVHLILPLLDSKGNPYAGIAAYAFSIENVNKEIVSTPSEEPTSDVTEEPTTPTPLDSHICYCYENCACEDDYLTEHLIIMNMPLSDLWNIRFKEFLSLNPISLSCDNAEDLTALLLSGDVSGIAYGVEINVIEVDTSYSSGHRFHLVINLPQVNVLTVGSNLFNNYHAID